ncbi:RNA polymerase sigma factor SigJ [Luteipulveratus mongoliensis]|uniref:RNA polymerase subunit sigma-24 n=1 Tax=Luteipulveratus mongoliensis TaxID=571913 RepID=A0A0K1JPP1_9MICO|nr:RNA polymerase sigma factor SigJ [Luteipulveratus mongoliensis]AKU18535.1 hypothetical protein VV02_01300 [Luteipulveratus mongoliensis]
MSERSSEQHWVAERSHLLALGYRMLGSWHDAEDVLQEVWIAWAAADRTPVRNPAAYLTTAMTRLSINRLRQRQRRQETYAGPWLPEPVATERLPEDSAVDRDSMSLATLHLLERLTPPERAAYVLRTGFAYSFKEIGLILDRTEPTSRQLYHRARERMDADARFQPDPAEHERLLIAVLAAARQGAVEDLERVLHEDAVLWSDGGGKVAAAYKPILGSNRVARFMTGIFAKHPYATRIIQVNGLPAVEFSVDGVRRIYALRIVDGAVAEILILANPDKLAYV